MLKRTIQRLKKNIDPRETKSGQFEKSFEKVVDRIQLQLPRNKMHGVGGSNPHSIPTFDSNYGEKSFEVQQGSTQDELWGRQQESAEEQQRRLNMNTLRGSSRPFEDRSFQIESAREKLRRIRGTAGTLSAAEQKKVNDQLLKTSKEASEYYYAPATATTSNKYYAYWAAAGVLTIGISLSILFSPRRDPPEQV